MTANPFEILRLDPSAGEEEIVRQAGRLRQRATDEADRNAIRQAVQALTARAEDRQLFALLTHSAPCHRWPALDRFTVAFRRPPVPANASEPCPPLDLQEFAALLRELAADDLTLSPLVLEPLPADETSEEMERQTAELIWQSMLFDTSA